MNEVASILAIGDVHLGTSCSGFPEDISSWGVEPSDLTPAAALRTTVDFAIKKQVDAVLFAGDLVESTNARFEAMLPLEESTRRLLEAGIQVIAVAGNHDVEALPRLSGLIEGFTLLGAGGRWESVTLARAGKPFAEVIGWSFAEKHVRQSPVALLLGEPVPALPHPVPRIGLLHGDLGASGGSYAPIRQTELDDTGYDAWLLGHIHKPSLDGLSTAGGSRPSGYLGSLVGLDPSEMGPHGPWLVELPAQGNLVLKHIPLAPLRWEEVNVPMDGLDHLEDLPDRLLALTRDHLQVLAQTGPTPRVLGLRVRLTGTSAAYGDIRKWVAAEEWKSLVRLVDDTVIFFNRIVEAMALPLDLAKLASGDDPVALLARRLLLVEQDNEASREFLDRARKHLDEVAQQDVWNPVHEHRNASDPLSDDALRDVLLRSGMAALDAMLAGEKPDIQP